MSARFRQVTAAAAAATTAAAGVGVLWLAARTPLLSEDRAGSAANALFVVGMVTLAATGWLLIRHGRHPVMGWLLVGTGLANVVGRLALAGAVAARDSGDAASAALAWTTNWVWLPGQALALLLIVRFPDGRLPGRAWRVFERVVLGWAGLAVLATALVPGPLGAEPLEARTNPVGLTAAADLLDASLTVLFAAMPLLVVTAVACSVLRWRRALPEERHQLEAVALALAFLAVVTPLALVSQAGAVAEGLAWLVIPVAIAYAVARHDLWDLDLRSRFDRLRDVRAEERSRLQRDLHDTLGPLLGSISMRVEAVRNLLDADAPRPEVDRLLASIGGEAENAVVEVRRFIDELAPSALAETDLVTALARLVTGYAESGVPVTFRADDDLPALDAAAEVALYRVAGEALRNVARHAAATRCAVTLRVETGDVVLEVLDDGVGLRDQPAGVGRRAMADRITALGGAFTLSERPVGGVQLTARLAGAAP
jgi:signal transduction histidine kinase